MSVTFASDNPPLARLRQTLRTVATFSVVVALLVYSGVSSKITLAVAGIGLFLAAIWLGRLRWGNEIVFEGPLLLVKRNGTTRHSIPASSITAATVRKGAIAVAWQEQGKRKSVVFGHESFLGPTFERLSDAIMAFAPPDKMRHEPGRT
jgi:hypothetical protein